MYLPRGWPLSFKNKGLCGKFEHDLPWGIHITFKAWKKVTQVNNSTTHHLSYHKTCEFSYLLLWNKRLLLLWKTNIQGRRWIIIVWIFAIIYHIRYDILVVLWDWGGWIEMRSMGEMLEAASTHSASGSSEG